MVIGGIPWDGVSGGGWRPIVVAHKPSLVRHTDKILLLHQGTVKEFGETRQVLGKYLAPHTSQAVSGGAQ